MPNSQTNPIINDTCDNVPQTGDAKWLNDIAKMFEDGKRYALETLRENSYREGFAEGLAEARAETQREIVKNMLLQKYDVEVISRLTGISVDEVKRLGSAY
jgi:flagellar biosynthesis/type III secretory pathway protein FliH